MTFHNRTFRNATFRNWLKPKGVRKVLTLTQRLRRKVPSSCEKCRHRIINDWYNGVPPGRRKMSIYVPLLISLFVNMFRSV